MGQTKIANRQISGGLDGWIPAEETWTYASADDPTFTFTISGDKTGKYSVGMKIKLTQTTAKYFIITAISYSSPNTTVTVYGGTDYDLANAAITANYYSMVKSPQGFPMSPAKWSVLVTDTTSRSKSSPSPGTWYYADVGSINISLPIGVWNTRLSCLPNFYTGSAINQKVNVALSASTSSATDLELFSYVGGQNLLEFFADVNLTKLLILTSKTTYYVILKTDNGSVGSIGLRNNERTLVIQATCAYL